MAINIKNLKAHLRKQGFDNRIYAGIAEIMLEHILTWKSKELSNPNKADVIVAFSFGFRFKRNGNKEPGRINELLADKVVDHYKKKPRHVYAQWEICEALRNRIPKKHLHSSFPKIDRKKNKDPVKYLSTEDVLKNVKKKLKNGNAKALIFAHRYHLLRCAWLARKHGLKIIIAPDMPTDYDKTSGQQWTSNGKTYIVSEIISRLSAYREKILYRETRRKNGTLLGKNRKNRGQVRRSHFRQMIPGTLRLK